MPRSAPAPNLTRSAIAAAAYRRALAALRRHGILLQADARLPSVSSIVAGAPVRGSWWAAPEAHAIYDVCQRLDHHADVALARLVCGKLTYMHRSLWPALAVAGIAREPWKTEGLSEPTRRLLAMVRRGGEVRTDELPPPTSASWLPAARDLEQRLLVHGEEFHTARGAHAKRLETWERWAGRAGVVPNSMAVAEARALLGAALAGVNVDGSGWLPWQTPRRRRSSTR